MEEKLIAPCGMNCGVCISFLSMKNDLHKQGINNKYCEGCLPRGKNCLHMGDRCQTLMQGLIRFCYGCKEFPCKRLKGLDKRYRTKYHLSMIENLWVIKKHGLDYFLEKEKEKWSCPDCGNTICCHKGLCLNCQIDILHQNRKYRWGDE